MSKVRVSMSTRRKNASIQALIEKVRKNSNNLAYHYAQRVEGGAKRHAHVITGHMRKSIKRTRVSTGRHKVRVGAHYGIYEEYGTRYRPPHPFFRPAIAEAKAAYDIEKRKVFR